ncbi:hypothetical protein JTB14_003529 [Gonioctena quinquepunctata]|nr:hypothetical protein JTB14_003529 [Gonioctena quinquepunctata]
MEINEATSRKRLKCGNVPQSMGRFTSDIPVNLAAELDHEPITKKDLQVAVYRFVEANNFQHRFNKSKGIAVSLGNLQDAVEVDDIIDAVSVSNKQSIGEIDNTYSPSVPLLATPPPAFQFITNLAIMCEDGIVIASPSKVVEEVAVNLSASDLLSLPKSQEKPNRNKHKSQKYKILSSTSFKDELEALAQEKKKKEEKRATTAKRKLRNCTVSGTSRKLQNQKKEDVSYPKCGDLYSKSEKYWITCS